MAFSTSQWGVRHLTIPILLLSLATTSGARTTASAQTPLTPIFVFAQPFWINLHHFLYVLGRVENKASDIQRRAVAGAKADQDAGLASLNDDERRAWLAAVAAYAAGPAKQDMVFDKDLFSATQALAKLADDAAPRGGAIPAELSAALERAAPIYRKAWWPAHNRANTARIKELNALLAIDGPRVLTFITHAYEEPWPDGGYPVNVSGYANWAGAYSTADRLLVFSSLDTGNTGRLGLEIVFHEAMHQWDDAMFEKLRAAARRVQKTQIPGGLTHAMIFMTAGEAVRSVTPTHVPYATANGLWDGDVFARFKPVLDAAWMPRLTGFTPLVTALDDVMRRVK